MAQKLAFQNGDTQTDRRTDGRTDRDRHQVGNSKITFRETLNPKARSPGSGKPLNPLKGTIRVPLGGTTKVPLKGTARVPFLV